MNGFNENVIEWLTGSKTASLTITQPKYINKIKALAKERPDECQILVENEDDGSIFVHVPVRWIRINPPRTLSDEAKLAAAERLKSNLKTVD